MKLATQGNERRVSRCLITIAELTQTVQHKHYSNISNIKISERMEASINEELLLFISVYKSSMINLIQLFIDSICESVLLCTFQSKDIETL